MNGATAIGHKILYSGVKLASIGALPDERTVTALWTRRESQGLEVHKYSKCVLWQLSKFTLVGHIEATFVVFSPGQRPDDGKSLRIKWKTSGSPLWTDVGPNLYKFI